MILPDMSTLVTIGVTAVLTATAAQVAIGLKDHLKERSLQRREGQFSGLYTALFFEEYARSLVYVLDEVEAHIYSSGHAGTDRALPSLPDFPKEIDWQRVGINLTERAFGFRVEVDFRVGQIADEADANPPDGYTWPTRLACVDLAFKSLAIADATRTSFGLSPAHAPNPEFSIRHYLTERRAEHDRIEKLSEQLREKTLHEMARLAGENGGFPTL